MIKSISIEELVLVCKRADQHPGVFEDVELTLSGGNHAGAAVQHISAYVHSCAATEKRQDAEFLQLQLRFLELTEEQRLQLSSLIVDNT